MTSVEKAKKIIEQGGNCIGLICEGESTTACPCADIDCEESNWPKMIATCEEFLERQNMQPVTSALFNIQDSTENVNALLAIKSEEASKLPLYSEHEESNNIDPVSKYNKPITGLDGARTSVDVYRVLVAFGIVDPELQHAIKKLLNLGTRGKGTYNQDLNEAILSLEKMKERKEQECK